MKKNIFLTVLICYTFISSAQVVTTFAGSTQGYADGTGTAAQFAGTVGVCTDATGNIYVSDDGNNRIRKISPAGVVTTFAGSGTSGNLNGTGTAAQFRNPSGICTDAAGNVYIADFGSNEIRKITPAGVVTSFAGGGPSGTQNGTGAAAGFYYPSGVCADTAGNVYVADTINNRIRKITPAGVVTTFAGSTQGYADGYAIGTVPAALFNRPIGVCTDAIGNVYVADMGNNRIRKINTSGIVTTVAGSGTVGSLDGIGTSAQFWAPYALCIDTTGNLYVADRNNNKIRKITPAGVVTTVAGSTQGYADGTGTVAQFNWPEGICFDTDGNLFVSDYYNSKIRKITGVLGVNQNTMKNGGVMVYPNPVNDKFIIDFGNQIISNYTIKINNLLGQEVYSTTTIDKSQVEVFNTWQGKGLYFVNIIDSQGHTIDVKKIILQ